MNIQEFIQAFKKVQQYIDVIYFTDRQTYTKEPNAIFCAFDLNLQEKHEKSLSDITKFVHIMIDLLCSVRLPGSVSYILILI